MTRGRSATTTKVFVGSLPSGVTTDDLRKLFAPYGAIAECDIANRCGFLHLEDQDLAMKAIQELNGTDFMGGKISVEKGRVKPRRGAGGPMRGGPRDRIGPYARGGGDFRGGPRNGGFRDDRDGPPYRGGGFPPRGGFDDRRGGGPAGYGDRRGPMQPVGFDDRRGGPPSGFDDQRGPPGPYDDRRGGNVGGGSGGYGQDRFGGGYVDRHSYDSGYEGPGGGQGFEDRRPMMGDRRPMMDASARGPGGGGDLFSRRDPGGLPKPGGGYGGNRSYGGANNGYGESGYGGGADRGGYGAPGGGGGSGGAASSSGYGGPYGAEPVEPVRGGSYDTAYPPLPPQRGFANGGGGGAGGPGSRRDLPPGRRF